MSLSADISAHRGAFRVEVSFSVEPRRTLAILGPNGAGKTSLLHALAGLVALDRGRILLDGTVLEDVTARVRVPTERRPIGVVFQDYLLFPHLTATENIAFGLRARGAGRRHALAIAQSWLERVGLDGCGDKRPAQLSGGQAQRVALARAMAIKPGLLLLDEPMAALDATTRISLRRDLRRHLGSFDGVRVLITHDPVEAMATADHLLVMEAGRVLQSGTPAEVTQRPRSRYVADLVGVNLFRGHSRANLIELADGGWLTVAGADDGDVFAIIHPRMVSLYRTRPDGTPRNLWEAQPVDLDVIGDRARVRLAGRPSIVAEVTTSAVRELGLDEGKPVWVAVKATEIEVYAA